MKIEIILPYQNAEIMANVWAVSEAQTDFENPTEATRCTLSYAAAELQHFLGRTIEGEVVILSVSSGQNPAITLQCEGEASKSCNYRLIPQKNGTLIYGEGRIGVLYGAYEFLKMQGWRWYQPGPVGEIAPAITDRIIYPKEALEFTTQANLGRGLAIEGALKESEELLIWMARNRLNLCGNRPYTRALMKKLGIIARDGGHIFATILDPDRHLPSGKTIWEEHPNWYGQPAQGELTRQTALDNQFCVSQPDLMDFICQEFLAQVMGPWKDADEVDVWGLDTWGGICNCPACQALGNGTDQNLHLVSRIRTYLNKARLDGRLDHDVKLVICSYEGTNTLEPPVNKIPQNLLDAGDFVLYAPIVRCYEHTFADPDCSYNRLYNEALEAWGKLDNPIDLMVLEYYNVSKFEDLPLLFTRTMQKDFQHYRACGIRGYSYMHLPLVNWGVRTLTQLLYAELAWNPDADIDAFLEEYFKNRYGIYHTAMAEVYRDLENAWVNCTSLRAWKDKSLLTQLQRWNGAIPTTPLKVDDHFATPENFEAKSLQAEALMVSALKNLETVLQNAKDSYSPALNTGRQAVNPIELRKQQLSSRLYRALSEDKRSMLYGLDSYRLLLRLAQYYNALYQNNKDAADTLWSQVEALENKLESYYMPLTFTTESIEIISNDALTRTQLTATVQRCRAQRKNFR